MNNSPCLDRPLLPLAVALPRLLEKIEIELAAAAPPPAADLIRELLTPRQRSPIQS